MERHWRRWVLAAGGMLLTVVMVAAAGWHWWWPEYRPALNDGERYGVDVSHHQGEIDWEKVANDDIAFAYIKATEGGDFVDDAFAENWAGAGRAGLGRGAYHFFTLCRPGKDQAKNFLATVPDDPDALPPALDLELAGNCSDRPPQEWVDEQVGVFLAEVEQVTGREVVLYLGTDFEGRYPMSDTLDRPTWRRRIFRRPDGNWWIWQFHAWASVSGIDGGADLNVMAGPVPE